MSPSRLLKANALVALPVLALSLIFSAQAASVPLTKRQGISALSAAQVAGFRPYTRYASAGYCAPATTKSWTCGANCQANPTFKPVASGGDGSSVQDCG